MAPLFSLFISNFSRFFIVPSCKATRKSIVTWLNAWVSQCSNLNVKCPPKAHIFEYFVPVLVLFGKVRDSLGSRASFEDICHQNGLWHFVAWPHFLYVDEMWSLCFQNGMPVLPRWTVFYMELLVKEKLFFYNYCQNMVSQQTNNT